MLHLIEQLETMLKTGQSQASVRDIARVNEHIRLAAVLRQRAATVRAEPTPAPWFLASQYLHEPYILEKVADWIEKGEI